MSKPLPTIEIEELREAGEDGGDLMGYYCRGHVDRHAFATASNKYSGARDGYDIRRVDAKRVRHVWWRSVQMADEPRGTFEYRPSLPGPGAWAATVCDSVANNARASARRSIREFDRGRCSGIAEGVNWALKFLDHHGPEISEQLLAAFRAARPELETETDA